ncbi:MAG: cyclase family protein, partial [Vicinamibacteraceae bacterium]
MQRHERVVSTRLARAVALAALLILPLLPSASGVDQRRSIWSDLSLAVDPRYPVNWPMGFPPFVRVPYLRIGPRSLINSDLLLLDEHTGTQVDAPAHGPVTGALAKAMVDRVPIAQWFGEACVIDVRSLLDRAENGVSPLIRVDHVRQWEQEHRPLSRGDVVLFRSDH